jgi:hypothetical protein
VDVTENGMLWMVSPGSVAALATVSSSSLLTFARSRSARVVGRPTLMQKDTNSLNSRVGRSSRANWVSVPKLTFSPCMKWWVCGSAVSPLCTA